MKSMSPYSLTNCDKVADICQTSSGKFAGPIYPSLMAIWNVTFDIPIRYKTHQPFPTTPFQLSVEAEICFRYNQRKKDDHAKFSGSCCADNGRYSDINEDCRLCPKNSVPRLHGYFCESCPIGHEPRNP